MRRASRGVLKTYRTYGQQKEIDQNRTKYPDIAKVIDEIRQVFPGAKVKKIYKKGYFRVKRNENAKENKSDCSDNASVTKTKAGHTPTKRG